MNRPPAELLSTSLGITSTTRLLRAQRLRRWNRLEERHVPQDMSVRVYQAACRLTTERARPVSLAFQQTATRATTATTAAITELANTKRHLFTTLRAKHTCSSLSTIPIVARHQLSRPRANPLAGHHNRTTATMSSKLIPSNPSEVMVIRDISPNVVTFSVPFARFGIIRVGGRATLGGYQLLFS
jgi:phosphoserine aminotransferase